MDANLDITVQSGSELLVTMAGELDYETSPRLRAVWGSADATSAGSVRIDLAALTFLDSAGVAEFIYAYRRAKEAGQLLTLAPVSETANRVLEVSGLLDLLRVSTSHDDASTSSAPG